MANIKESGIQWTKYTWNPWTGCNHISADCDFCYAERTIEGRWGRDFKVVNRSANATFNKPLKIAREVSALTPFQDRLVFTCSWSDFFHKRADGFRPEAWKIIKDTPQLIYQILTKRPERMAENMPADYWDKKGEYENVWLGVTVEDNKALSRIDYLATMGAKVHFSSVEPLIEDISQGLKEKLIQYKGAINWIILGGESGNETGKYLYRPSELKWFTDIIATCQELEIPVFFKQTGTHLSKKLGLSDRHGGDNLESKFPNELRVTEFPKYLHQKDVAIAKYRRKGWYDLENQEQ